MIKVTFYKGVYMEMKRLTIEVSENVFKRIKIFATLENTNMRVVVTKAILADLEDREKYYPLDIPN